MVGGRLAAGRVNAGAAGAVWTAGYQGRSPEELVETLTGAGVGVVVDVRNRAASHRPWFGRRALERLLAGAGIG
ncbi:MAG: DUF488 family protein, partial [Chloroflexi bacterium]|nr:DUF488 family protein [Chloroflexota bacterium]